MVDLVGIGSINVDIVVVGSGGGAASGAGTGTGTGSGTGTGTGTDAHADAPVDLGDPRLGLAEDDIGSERVIDAVRSKVALDYLSRFDPIVGPGGSALNVCVAVAGTGAPISVGHIGVCGTAGPPGFSFPEWFRSRGIDTEHVELVDGPPGLCLAITQGSERTLLTTGGVNAGLGRLIAERADAIIEYLLAADVVHVTATAEVDDLEPLVDLLDRVRARRTRTATHRPRTATNRTGSTRQTSTGPQAGTAPLISCDPGAIWTSPGRPPAADEIMARCDQLLLNRRELAALGGAEAILGRWAAIDLVVAKAPEWVDVHRRDVGPTRHPNPSVLGPDEIVDDTGAGDAFTAGFLLGQLLPDLSEAHGIRLGMDLARAKLGFPGLSLVDRFAAKYRALTMSH